MVPRVLENKEKSGESGEISLENHLAVMRRERNERDERYGERWDPRCGRPRGPPPCRKVMHVPKKREREGETKSI